MHLPEENSFTRRSFVKLLGATTAAAGIAASLTACGSANKEGTSSTSPAASGSGTGATANPDGTITAGISYELGTNGYDPMTTTAALTVAANWHTMEGLTELHPDTREVYAALGKELPKQVDDTTWEVTLRDKAVFHNGEAVTTDDVVFSFERVLSPENKSIYASFLPFIEGVTKKDETTVTIKTKYPFSLVAERLATVKIVPKAAVEADAAAFDQNPIGTGAWKMTNNGAQGGKVIFERNDSYSGPRPALAKNMVWEILPDNSTRTNALSSGTVQAIDAVAAADLTTLASSKKVAAEQGFGLIFAMFNSAEGAVMNDVRNRQAVMYALDYEKICKTGMSDLATPATCFVQEDHPAYKKAATVYTMDQAKSKALLAETGLTEIRLLCTNHGWFESVRPMIKESLEAVGLTVHYEELKSADAYNKIDSSGDVCDVLIAPGDPSVFGDDADLLLRWWYAGDLWTDTRMHWKGSESYNQVQTLLEAASAATGEDQLSKWHEIFDIVAAAVPLYPLLHRKTPTAYDGETLVNFQPIAVTGLSFVDVSSTK